MKRGKENAPSGSRVHSQTKDGVKNQSGPNWSDFASKEQTWNILDELKNIAEKNKKSVAQVATRFWTYIFLQHFQCGFLGGYSRRKMFPP